MQCRKFNNFVSKIFAVLFKSDRSGCIRQIKEKGMEKHAEIMKNLDRPSMRKR
jgi:hypothetical protein